VKWLTPVAYGGPAGAAGVGAAVVGGVVAGTVVAGSVLATDDGVVARGAPLVAVCTASGSDESRVSAKTPPTTTTTATTAAIAIHSRRRRPRLARRVVTASRPRATP
jgi:hypothetical protein